MKHSTILKIKALAEHGVGGEKDNAKAILNKVRKHPRILHDKTKVFCEVETRDVTTKDAEWQRIIVIAEKKPLNIEIPYLEYVLQYPDGQNLWKKICKRWADYLAKETKGAVVQNSTNKITVCTIGHHYCQLQNYVHTATYEMLALKGVPVIHEPLDNWGCGDSQMPNSIIDSRCMEGAIYPTSIYEGNYVNGRKVPSPINELKAIKVGDPYNYAINTEDGKRYWGFISSYDPMTGVLEITPRNRHYPAKKLHDSDIESMYRVRPGYSWKIAGTDILHYESPASKRSDRDRAAWEQTREEFAIIEAPILVSYHSGNFKK